MFVPAGAEHRFSGYEQLSVLVIFEHASDVDGRRSVELLDAYWRAANYLSVGQIYLLDNPLLREPLRPEHVKPRLLGHFGTTPGLNLVYAHLNRAIRERDLDAIYIAGPGHGGPGSSRTPTSRARTASSTRTSARDEEGLRDAVPAVLVPGRDPEPRRARDAGLDPRGRRARLRARARLRRRVRQPRPARRVRRRRRRGRDRAARDELALEQVPEPAHRRRRPADPAPERLQDREPDRARPDPRGRARRRCSRATAGDRSLVVRRRAGRACTSSFAAALDEALDAIARCAARARRRRAVRPAALADDRAAHAEGLDRAQGGRRPAGRGHVALAPGAGRRRARATRSTCASSRSGCAATGPRSCSTRTGGSSRSSRELRAARRAAHEREPARERRRAAARPRAARLPRLRRRRSSEPANDVERGDARARRLPARRDRAQPRRTSASSAPTRPRRTGSATCFEVTRPRLGRRDAADRRATSPRTAA